MNVSTQLIADNDLVYSYQQNNCQQSIAELINRYKDKVYTKIFYIVKDRFIAEDILQDTLIKAAENIRRGKYTDQGKFAPWITRIAHNLCIDHIRKSKSSTKIQTVSNELMPYESLGITFDNAHTVLENKENETEIWKLLYKLPPEQLEVIVLRIYGQLSFKEISDAMNVSINTSLGRMRYGLMNLKKMITENNMCIR